MTPTPRDTPPPDVGDPPADEAPNAERWFQVMLLACAPVLSALALPRAFLWPLATCSAVLFLIGLVMFLRRPRNDGDD